MAEHWHRKPQPWDLLCYSFLPLLASCCYLSPILQTLGLNREKRPVESMALMFERVRLSDPCQASASAWLLNHIPCVCIQARL